jgi:hypothetical protein
MLHREILLGPEKMVMIFFASHFGKKKDIKGTFQCGIPCDWGSPLKLCE